MWKTPWKSLEWISDGLYRFGRQGKLWGLSRYFTKKPADSPSEDKDNFKSRDIAVVPNYSPRYPHGNLD